MHLDVKDTVQNKTEDSIENDFENVAEIPSSLGEVVAEYRIEPGTAIAYKVKSGQLPIFQC